MGGCCSNESLEEIRKANIDVPVDEKRPEKKSKVDLETQYKEMLEQMRILEPEIEVVNLIMFRRR